MELNELQIIMLMKRKFNTKVAEEQGKQGDSLRTPLLSEPCVKQSKK